MPPSSRIPRKDDAAAGLSTEPFSALSQSSPLNDNPELSEDNEETKSLGEESTNELLDMITSIKTDLGQLRNKNSKVKFNSPFGQSSGNCEMGSVTHQYGIELEEQEEMIDHTFRSLQIIQSLKPVDVSEIQSKMVTLERKTSHEKLMVFDLDETLAHCTFKDDQKTKDESDVQLIVPAKSGKELKVGFNLRPKCREVLLRAAENFEVVVFTASMKNYADAILDHIDPDRTLIHHRLYRDSCVFSEDAGIFIKDLRIFDGFDLKDIVLVDNAVYSFSFQLDNGVPIIPFRDNTKDDQLDKLIAFLPILAGQDDVRPRLQSNFQLSSLMEFDLSTLFSIYTEEEETPIDECLDQISEGITPFMQQIKGGDSVEGPRHKSDSLLHKKKKKPRKSLKILKKRKSDLVSAKRLKIKKPYAGHSSVDNCEHPSSKLAAGDHSLILEVSHSDEDSDFSPPRLGQLRRTDEVHSSIAPQIKFSSLNEKRPNKAFDGLIQLKRKSSEAVDEYNEREGCKFMSSTTMDEDIAKFSEGLSQFHSSKFST